MIKNTRAIDIVVNIWTAQALANRPDRADFYKKMRVPSELYEGISLETMIQRMDDAGIERAMLIAAKVGDRNHPYCYHVPYDLVKEAVQQYPNRFYALAGLDPTEGMNGIRALEKAVKGMLPKGPLGYAMIKKLKVYGGAEHPHSAQQPKPLDI